MTTFFRTGDSARVDSWSVRVASVRTADVLLIRRLSEGLFEDMDHLLDDVAVTDADVAGELFAEFVPTRSLRSA